MNIYRNFDANTICTEMIFTVAWLFIYIKTKIQIIIKMNIYHYKKWFYNKIKWLVYLTYSTICYKYSKLFLLTRSFRCECSYRAQVTEITNENHS